MRRLRDSRRSLLQRQANFQKIPTLRYPIILSCIWAMPPHAEGMDKSSVSSLSFHKKPGHSALRRGRDSVPGQRYLVTFTTYMRRDLFSNHALALDASKEIHDPRSWQKATLLAWVLMPDHWHGLIELGEGESLSELMRTFKANVSRRLRINWPGLRSVWGKSFHDRALRHEEDTIALTRYIVLNPVRAGLVCKVGDYPFWNAVWL